MDKFLRQSTATQEGNFPMQVINRRKSVRYDYLSSVLWDYFAETTGSKRGFLTNLSTSGCLLCTYEPIELRRWIRFIIQDPSSNLLVSAVGRVARRDLHIFSSTRRELQSYRHGIQFTYPNYFSLAATDLILALSRRNFTVRSCLNLNSRSAICPEFFA